MKGYSSGLQNMTLNTKQAAGEPLINSPGISPRFSYGEDQYMILSGKSHHLSYRGTTLSLLKTTLANCLRTPNPSTP